MKIKNIIYILIFISCQSFAEIDHKDITGKEFINALNSSNPQEKKEALFYAQATFDSFSIYPWMCPPENFNEEEFFIQMNVWLNSHKILLTGDATELLEEFAISNYACEFKLVE